MAFDRKNFAQIAGTEISPDRGLPLIFSYFAGDDTIADCLIPAYFGLASFSPVYDEKTSVSTYVNRGALILVNSNNSSGNPARFEALLVVASEQNDSVLTEPATAWAP